MQAPVPSPGLFGPDCPIPGWGNPGYTPPPNISSPILPNPPGGWHVTPITKPPFYRRCLCRPPKSPFGPGGELPHDPQITDYPNIPFVSFSTSSDPGVSAPSDGGDIGATSSSSGGGSWHPQLKLINTENFTWDQWRSWQKGTSSWGESPSEHEGGQSEWGSDVNGHYVHHTERHSKGMEIVANSNYGMNRAEVTKYAIEGFLGVWIIAALAGTGVGVVASLIEIGAAVTAGVAFVDELIGAAYLPIAKALGITTIVTWLANKLVEDPELPQNLDEFQDKASAIWEENHFSETLKEMW